MKNQHFEVHFGAQKRTPAGTLNFKIWVTCFFYRYPGGAPTKFKKLVRHFIFHLKVLAKPKFYLNFGFFPSIFPSIFLSRSPFFSNFGIGIPKFRWTFSGRCKPFRVYHSRGTLLEADFRYTTILAGPWAAAQRTNRKTWAIKSFPKRPEWGNKV